MLSGDGADELLTTPAFLGRRLAQVGVLNLLRYLRDHEPADIVATAVSSTAELVLSRKPESAAHVYNALISNPAGEGEAALDPAFAARVREWSREYDGTLQDLLSELLSDGWAHAEAHLAIWPQDQLHLGSEVPVRSPFLEQPFVGHALWATAQGAVGRPAAHAVSPPEGRGGVPSGAWRGSGSPPSQRRVLRGPGRIDAHRPRHPGLGRRRAGKASHAGHRYRDGADATCPGRLGDGCTQPWLRTNALVAVQVIHDFEPHRLV